MTSHIEFEIPPGLANAQSKPCLSRVLKCEWILPLNIKTCLNNRYHGIASVDTSPSSVPLLGLGIYHLTCGGYHDESDASGGAGVTRTLNFSILSY